jgi:hypothetical protein
MGRQVVLFSWSKLLSQRHRDSSGCIGASMAHPDPASEPDTGGLAITRESEPRIDGLTFQGKHPENAFMYPSERLTIHESLQCFEAESKLAYCQ